MDERCDGLIDMDGALAGVGATICKIDPARVESVDHLHARRGIFHALGTEDRFPLIARHDLATYGCAERFGERLGEGAGIAQILEIGCEQLLRSGRLVELFPDWSDERFPLYAIYASRLYRAAKVRAFIEFCLEIMGGNVPKKSADRRESSR
jgi:DNA-binding transcriptional LysR family regulator